MSGLRRRGIGRPPLSGPEAEANPLSELSFEERRELFLEAAVKLFEEKGYKNTSVEDIAGELGFTKKVFYYYWKNKREIVQEIHDRGMALMNAQLDAVMEEEREPGARLDAAIRNHLRTVLRDRSIAGTLLGDFEFSEETLRARREYTRRFQRLVEEGMAAGVVRRTDPRMLTFAILGLCNSVGAWYRSDGRLTDEEIIDIFAVFAACGWCAGGSGEGSGEGAG
ncbi:MAG: TetR family transcriptional regulator [Rubrobacteraceae bacterium]|nr:TetR family transcriptional regulator [Rubrobacteraceae bacterium]